MLLPATQPSFWLEMSRVLRSRELQDAFKGKFQEALERRLGAVLPAARRVAGPPGHRAAREARPVRLAPHHPAGVPARQWATPSRWCAASWHSVPQTRPP